MAQAPVARPQIVYQPEGTYCKAFRVRRRRIRVSKGSEHAALCRKGADHKAFTAGRRLWVSRLAGTMRGRCVVWRPSRGGAVEGHDRSGRSRVITPGSLRRRSRRASRRPMARVCSATGRRTWRKNWTRRVTFENGVYNSRGQEHHNEAGLRRDCQLARRIEAEPTPARAPVRDGGTAA